MSPTVLAEPKKWSSSLVQCKWCSVAAQPSLEAAQAVIELWQQIILGLTAEQRHQLRTLLKAYFNIFTTQDNGCHPTAVETVDAQPIWLHLQGLTLVKRQAMEQEIRVIVAVNVLEPLDTPWAAPVVLVQKKDG